MRSPAPRARRPRTRPLAFLVALVGVLAGPATAAQAGTITECTPAAVTGAIAAGGSHTFACDGRIALSTQTVPRTVSFDADGRNVIFAGTKPNQNTETYLPTNGESRRVFKVVSGGALTLRGITVEDGLFISPIGAPGQRGTNGADGRATSPPFGAAGPAGGDGKDDAGPGGPAPVARGGCFLVEAGGSLVLRNLTVRRCQAATNLAGYPGAPGYGGLGGGGMTGAPGQGEYPVGTQAGDGGPGGAGGAGGSGGAAAEARDGSNGEGGAIYSAGALDVLGVRFEDNTVRGGRGGEGGDGGGGNYGGRGGYGGRPGCSDCYGPRPKGGNGGAAGAPGTSRPGADGGDGGDGHGGAIWAGGDTSISGAIFARNTAAGGGGGPGGDGGDGGGGEFGEPGGCIITNGGRGLDCSYAGERGGAVAGTAGSDAGDTGDGGDALGGAVFFDGDQPPPVDTSNAANVVTPGSGHAAACAAQTYSYFCAQPGYGGQNITHACRYQSYHGYNPNPPPQVPDCTYAAQGAKGQPGADGRAADADIGSDKATGLKVSVTYPEKGEPGYRFPVDEPVTATVEVSVASDARGLIGGITFDEDLVLREVQGDLLTFSGTDPPPPFALSPGAKRTFEVEVTGTARGNTALFAAVTGKDALNRTAEASDRQTIKVGHDIQVKVTADPDDLDLDRELDPDTGRPPTKPVELTVSLENVSGEALEDVELDLRAEVRTLVARDPLAPDPLQIEARRGEDGQPDTPLTRSEARNQQLGDLAVGQKKTWRYAAKAADKAIVDVKAYATGTTTPEPRTVTGNGKAPVRIGSPAVLSLTADEPLRATVQGGGLYTYSGTVKNISPDEDVTVLLRADRAGPIVGGEAEILGVPGGCGGGIFLRLAPGERLPFVGQPRGTTDAAGHATIDLNLTGRRHTYDSEGKPIEVPIASEDILVADGADRREMDIFQFDPVPEVISVGAAGWLFTDGAARGFGKLVTGTAKSVSDARAKAHEIWNTPKAVYFQWMIGIIRDEVPEAFEQAQADLVRTLLAFDDQLDSGEAIAIAREMWGNSIVSTEKAWEDATWQELSTKTGEVVGANAPGLLLEAALPALGSCKLLKFGGKTALIRRAERLGASRAGRLLAKGRKGLLPGDAISSLLARKLYGIDGIIDKQLIAYAKAKQVIIAVRDRSPGSIRRLAEGMLPKWEKVKAKNVSSLDVEFLGFDVTHLDTAMLKQMPEESVIRAKIAGKPADIQEKVMARWEQRKKEWEGKDRAEMEAYEQTGKIPAPSKEVGLNPTENGAPNAENVWTDEDFQLTRPGQGDPPLAPSTDNLPVYQPRAKKDGKFRAMTGDMDPIAVLDANGQIPSLERRMEIYRDLAKMGFQHPESLTWDNPAGRAKYLRDFDLANGDADALLAYHPDGSRRAAYFDSRKSRLDEVKEGFMALVGTEIALDAAGIVAGDVPVIPPPETEAPVYITPGGSVGANLSDTPGTKLIRRNLNGTFSQWTRERGWQPYLLPAGETVTTTPQTAIRTAVAAGQTRIDINEQDALILKPGAQSWFKPGDLVVLDPGGPNEEFVTVAALGSIITTEPLKKDHVSGEMVAVIPQPAPVAAAPAAPAPSGPAPAGPAGPAVAVRPPTPPRVGQPTAPPKAKAKAAAPRLSSVKLAKRRFSRRTGTKLTFKLDRATRVTVSLKRKVKGRRKGKSCSTKAKRGKRCTKYVKAKTTRIKAKKGRTRVTYGKRLRRGTYTARVSVKGGRRVTLRFTVR